MAEDHDDETLNRMRASDPARGSYPDQRSLRRRLMDRTPLGNHHAGHTRDPFEDSQADTAVRVPDGTTRGSRTTVVAAAAAAALAIAAGGYAVGAQSAHDGGRGGANVAATGTEEATRRAADGQESAGAAGTRPGETVTEVPVEGQAQALPPEQAQGGDAAVESGSGTASATSSYVPYGPTVLTAGPGLGTEGGTGAIRALRPADVDPAEFLTSWADALGLEGEVTETDDSYTEFASGAALLSLSSGASTDFNYHNLIADPYCAELVGEGGAEPYGGSQPLEPGDCLPLEDLPSEDEAITQAQEFLTAAGVPLEGVAWSTRTYEGDPQVTVSGSREDQPTNRFDVSVSGAGVMSAYGSLGEYESLGDYPVISTAEAVERASDPRFSQAGVWLPGVDDEALPLEEGLTLPGEASELAQPPAPLDIQAGDPLPFPVTQATIVEATLDTGLLSLNDGTQLLVPAYDLVDENGGHYPVLALAEDALNFTP